MDHHIQIEQLDDHDHHDHTTYYYPSYGSPDDAIELDKESDQDRINRLSNTSTLIGGTRGSSGLPPLQSLDSFSSSSSSCSSPYRATTPSYFYDDDSTKPTRPPSSLRNRAKTNPQDSKHSGDDKDAEMNPCSNWFQYSWYRFRNSESGRLVCAFLYFTVVCIGMAFCNQLSDHRWVKTGYTNVFLSDRGFDVIPAQSSIQPANTFVMTSVLFTVLGVGVICPDWKSRAIVLRRILWVIGTLSVYRALTLSVTTLPTPKEECRPSLKTGFWEMFKVALQMIPGTVEACTDDIFSGHTVFMVSCAIQWRLYCRNKWVTYFSYLYISVGLYYVVATRLHYTVDVVLAVFITYAVWSIYISMIDVVMEDEYFGIKGHHEKYTAFDSATAEYEFLDELDDHTLTSTSTTSSLSTLDCHNNGSEQDQERQIDEAKMVEEDEKEEMIRSSAIKSQTISSRRRQIEYHLNRLRGPRIGYGRGEYDRVAFVPMQFNVWLKSLIRWCDGLDLRMSSTAASSSSSTLSSCSSTCSGGSSTSSARWNELVVKYRAVMNSTHYQGPPDSLCSCWKKTMESEVLESEMGEYDSMGRRREMVQGHRNRNGAGLVFEGVRVDSFTNEAITEVNCRNLPQNGRWRSMGLRGSSSSCSGRARSPDMKSEKRAGKLDRNRKMFYVKIALVMFVSLIMLVKVIQVIQDRNAVPQPRWPVDMDTYPGGAINSNNGGGSGVGDGEYVDHGVGLPKDSTVEAPSTEGPLHPGQPDQQENPNVPKQPEQEQQPQQQQQQQQQQENENHNEEALVYEGGEGRTTLVRRRGNRRAVKRAKKPEDAI